MKVGQFKYNTPTMIDFLITFITSGGKYKKKVSVKNFCKNQQIDPKPADNVSKRGFDLQSKNILKYFHNGTSWQPYIHRLL